MLSSNSGPRVISLPKGFIGHRAANFEGAGQVRFIPRSLAGTVNKYYYRHGDMRAGVGSGRAVFTSADLPMIRQSSAGLERGLIRRHDAAGPFRVALGHRSVIAGDREIESSSTSQPNLKILGMVPAAVEC
jgi:hypothetical protein